MKFKKYIKRLGHTQTSYAAYLNSRGDKANQPLISKWSRKGYRVHRVNGQLKLYAPIRDLPEEGKDD